MKLNLRIHAEPHLTHRSESVSFVWVRITTTTMYKMCRYLFLSYWHDWSADKQISVVVANNWKLIDEKNDESCACYSHWKKLAGITEFQVRLLWSDAIDSCLWTYWNNRFRISKLRQTQQHDNGSESLNSSQPADNMSVYNYMHHDLFLTIEVSALLNWIDITSRGLRKKWISCYIKCLQLTVWIWFINVYNV
jgi:hypothetical protein